MASISEQHLHQDRIDHASKRQNEGQDGGSLVLEPVEFNLTAVDPGMTFSVIDETEIHFVMERPLGGTEFGS